MITKADLKVREFETIEDFFQHVINNGHNGNWGDVNKFIRKMNNPQRLDFYYWLGNQDSSTDQDRYKNILIELAYNKDF